MCDNKRRKPTRLRQQIEADPAYQARMTELRDRILARSGEANRRNIIKRLPL